jgi:hypothetical protein
MTEKAKCSLRMTGRISRLDVRFFVAPLLRMTGRGRRMTVKGVLVIGIWCFEFVWYLEPGI